jgi:hypothetical protein
MTIRDHSYETLASKADLRDLEPRLEVRFAQLEQKIADVQIGMVKWFTGIMIAKALPSWRWSSSCPGRPDLPF